MANRGKPWGTVGNRDGFSRLSRATFLGILGKPVKVGGLLLGFGILVIRTLHLFVPVAGIVRFGPNECHFLGLANSTIYLKQLT